MTDDQICKSTCKTCGLPVGYFTRHSMMYADQKLDPSVTVEPVARDEANDGGCMKCPRCSFPLERVPPGRAHVTGGDLCPLAGVYMSTQAWEHIISIYSAVRLALDAWDLDPDASRYGGRSLNGAMRDLYDSVDPHA